MMMEKAVFQPLEGVNLLPIPVMYNPSQYSLPIDVNWTGEKDKIPQYKGSSFGDFSVELLFDTYEKKVDVRDGAGGTNRIVALALPSVIEKESKRPPQCLFIWGKFLFKGVLQKVDQNFTMFLANGTPVRATLKVTLRPTISEKEAMFMKGVTDSRKFRVVKPGDRLDVIAHEELKDASLWPMIAELNSIKNPMKFPAPSDFGKTLIIPHVEI